MLGRLPVELNHKPTAIWSIPFALLKLSNRKMASSSSSSSSRRGGKGGSGGGTLVSPTEQLQVFYKLAALEAEQAAVVKPVVVAQFDAVNSIESKAYRAAFAECATENYVSMFESKIAEVQSLEERVPTAIATSRSQAREDTVRKAELVQLLADIDRSKETVASLQDTCRSQQQMSKRLEELHAQDLQRKKSLTSSGDGNGIDTTDIEMQVNEMEKRLIEKQMANKEQRERLEEIKVHMSGRQKRVEDLAAHDVLRKKLEDAIQAQRAHLLLQIDTKIGQMEAHILEIQRRNVEKRESIAAHNAKHVEHDKAVLDYRSFVAQMTETRQLKETMLQTLQGHNDTLRQEVGWKELTFIQAIDLRSALESEAAKVHQSNRDKDLACKELQARLKKMKSLSRTGPA